jgi:uncharacterized protein (TIGR02145 family)/uncharacterized repeat protein (TIGR02543 family)
MKLYALWSPNTYSITFVPNDAAITDSSYTQSAHCDSVIKLYKNRYQKSGFSFRGWTVHPDSQKYIGDEATLTMDTTNSTFYAQWTAKPIHNITATADSGVTLSPSGTLSIIEGESQTYSFVAKPDFLLSVVQVDGSENASAKASGTYTFENVDTAHQLSVTSIKKRFSLSYSIEADVGTVTGSIDAVPAGPQIDAGTTVKLTAPPDNGYNFLRWVKIDGPTKDTIGTANTLSYTVTGETVLKAVYAKNYAPVITLVGADTVTLVSGNSYNDSGVIAIDEWDGTLTDSVSIDTESVDIYIPGIYTVTYSVKDRSGSEAIKKRFVKVVGWKITPTTLVDPDGNTYTTVPIGNQLWTVQNLNTTKYRNGDSIPHVTDDGAWNALTTPGYCYYNNSTDPAEQKEWGAWYNWYTVVDTHGLAPEGWRVPTNDDWVELEQFLIDRGYAWGGGDKIAKALAAQYGWDSEYYDDPDYFSGLIYEDMSQNNESGFSALGGGCRYGNGGGGGGGGGRGFIGCWWSSSQDNDQDPYSRFLQYDRSTLDTYKSDKSSGFSVRLVKVAKGTVVY